MNVKTEERENTSSATMESGNGGHPAQQPATGSKDPRGQRTTHHRRGSWLALVALVAGAGLATATALEASDDSSNADPVPAVSDGLPREGDRDFHREPPQSSSDDPQPADWDRDFHRDPDESVKPYGSGLPHEAH